MWEDVGMQNGEEYGSWSREGELHCARESRWGEGRGLGYHECEEKHREMRAAQVWPPEERHCNCNCNCTGRGGTGGGAEVCGGANTARRWLHPNGEHAQPISGGAAG